MDIKLIEFCKVLLLTVCLIVSIMAAVSKNKGEKNNGHQCQPESHL